jgi:hypothetical protein
MEKKPIPMPALVAIAVVAVVGLVVAFMQMSADPAPTVQNAPDYAKMSDEEIAAAYAKSKEMEKQALADRAGK